MTIEEQIEEALRKTGKPLDVAAADIIRDQRQLIVFYKEQLSGLLAAIGAPEPSEQTIYNLTGKKKGTEK